MLLQMIVVDFQNVVDKLYGEMNIFKFELINIQDLFYVEQQYVVYLLVILNSKEKILNQIKDELVNVLMMVKGELDNF